MHYWSNQINQSTIIPLSVSLSYSTYYHCLEETVKSTNIKIPYFYRTNLWSGDTSFTGVMFGKVFVQTIVVIFYILYNITKLSSQIDRLCKIKNGFCKCWSPNTLNLLVSDNKMDYLREEPCPQQNVAKWGRNRTCDLRVRILFAERLITTDFTRPEISLMKTFSA